METRQWSYDDNNNDLSNYLIPASDLCYGDLLGSGGFGKVFKGKYQTADVAIKVFSKSNEESIDTLKHEVRIMSKLHHPNIITVFGINIEGSSCALVMELMRGGDLYQFLQSDQAISLQTRYQIAGDVAAGLLHLHSKNILHCDIKSPNVLLDNERKAKLTDFGLSKDDDDGSCPTATWAYMAPELINPELIDETKPKNSKATDVYAYGMLLWELWARKRPFNRLYPQEIAKIVSRGEREDIENKEIPPEISDLILACWHQDPNVRPLIDAALIVLKEHPVTYTADCSVIPLKPVKDDSFKSFAGLAEEDDSIEIPEIPEIPELAEKDVISTTNINKGRSQNNNSPSNVGVIRKVTRNGGDNIHEFTTTLSKSGGETAKKAIDGGVRLSNTVLGLLAPSKSKPAPAPGGNQPSKLPFLGRFK